MKPTYFRIFKDIHKAATVDTIDIDDKTTIITRVFVPLEKGGTGIGTEILNEVVSDADKDCRTLLIEPRPYFDRSEESYKKLILFYKKFGFKEKKDDYMFREPRCR